MVHTKRLLVEILVPTSLDGSGTVLGEGLGGLGSTDTVLHGALGSLAAQLHGALDGGEGLTSDTHGSLLAYTQYAHVGCKLTPHQYS